MAFKLNLNGLHFKSEPFWKRATSKELIQSWPLRIKTGKEGCRHSSVDSFAPTILPPRVWVPSTPSMLLSFIVKFVLYLSCEKNKIKQKRGRVWPNFLKSETKSLDDLKDQRGRWFWESVNTLLLQTKTVNVWSVQSEKQRRTVTESKNKSYSSTYSKVRDYQR